jgi:lipid II:glycine glycyltransferase (peptidoglycan interpeptide bridge formation enzyme)
MEHFYDCFHNYCKNNNIISEFVRFHPLLENVKYAPQSVDIRQYNQTVIIDLKNDEAEIYGKMNPKCRNKIRKAKKNNVKIEIDSNFNHIDVFIRNYHDTMKRLDAYDYYFFDYSWFYEMINLLRNKVYLFHAYLDNHIIASVLFIEEKPFIHYFLTGALYEKRHLAATNLLLYEVAIWAKKRGLEYFHLGGGCLPDDSLFRFKESFSPYLRDFYIGGTVHHPEYYEYLCQIRFGNSKPNENINYFPLYRIPLKYWHCKKYYSFV